MEGSKDAISLILAGDTMLGRHVNRAIDHLGYAYPWGDVLPVLRSADCVILNLETTLTLARTPVVKMFNFRATPDKVRCLTLARVDAVNLANNHILDYDVAGLLETLEVLDEEDVAHVGAGRNLEEARKPVVLEKEGIRIGLLGMTDNEPDWEAQAEQPGTRYVRIGDVERVKQDILSLRDEVDVLVLSLHWGPNNREYPSPEHVRFAHDLVDLGVDIIHGHSAHIFQGMEWYKGSLILYDTGDFVDDYMVDPQLRNDRSFLFKVLVNRQGVVDVELIPTQIADYQVNLATGESSEWSAERMKDLSASLAKGSLRR